MTNPSSTIYQATLDHIREVIGYDFASLAFAQSAKDEFVITWQYVSGNLNDRYKRIQLQSGKGIAGMVFKTGKPLLVLDVEEELAQSERFQYPIIVSEQLASLAAIPLFELDRVTGVLLVGYRGNKIKKSEFVKLQQLLGGKFGDFEVIQLTSIE